MSGALTAEEQLHTTLMRVLRENGGSPESVIALLGKVAKERTWQHLSRRQRGSFTTFTDYVETPINNGGLGILTGDVRTLLGVRTEIERRAGDSGDRTAELNDYREAIRTELDNDIPEVRPNHRPKAEESNVPPYLGGNNTVTGILSRLKIEDPELAEAVIAGEITSNAAARQKGWRYPRVELRSPQAVAARIREHFTENQIDDLIDELRR
jgi:hypothetical protein